MTAAQRKPTELAELRRALIENGYTPVPVDGKRPRVRGWQKLRPDPAQQDGFVRSYQDHTNTGILTGQVVGVDVDVLHPAASAEIRALVMTLPGAGKALVRIGKAPKALFLFRADTPLGKRMTAEYSIDGTKAQIEIMGSGQQVVAFGIHPDIQQPYRWETATPLEVPIADLPVITADTIDWFMADAATILGRYGTAEKKAASRAPAGTRASGKPTFFRTVNDQALSNLDEWVPVLFPSATLQATGAYRISSSDLGRGLQEDLSIHPDGVQDFGREQPATPIDLVTEFGGAADTRQAAFWLCERMGIEPEALGWEHRQPVSISFGKSQATPVPANDDDEDVEDWRREEDELFRSDSTLSDLTRPGGFVEELIDWIVSSAEHPSRELALSAVLPFVGALIGRRFSGFRDARSNIYSIALAPSGYGKDHARQQLKRLIASENLHKFAGPSRFMSASGLRAVLLEKPSICAMIDEFGGPLREMLDPRSGVHQTMLKNDLLEYFSTASTYFEGAAYAQVKPVKVENPNLCIYGTSTPDDFWDAMSSLSTRDGFMARMLLFNLEGQKPEHVEPTIGVKDIPQGIRTKAAALAMIGRGGSLDLPAADNGQKGRDAIEVPLSPAADQRRREFKHDVDAKLARVDGPNATVLNRAVEHAVKLALVVAVASDMDKPEVTERQMTWAIQLAWLSCVALMRESKLNVADGQREKNYNRVLKLITVAGGKGLTSGQLADRTRSIDRRQRDEILQDLHDAGRISAESRAASKAGGRPTVIYLAR